MGRVMTLSILTAMSFALWRGPGAASAGKAAFAYVVSHPSAAEGISGRRVVIAYETSILALKLAFPGDSVSFEGLVPGGQATKGEFLQVATCESKPTKRCRMPSDVVVLGILFAERRGAAVVIKVGFSYALEQRYTSSRSLTLLLERAEGVWKVTKVISGSVG